MASNKALSSTALFLSLNLLFFSMVSSASPSKTRPPPPPTSKTPPPPLPTCPINILNLKVCASLLGLVGSPPTSPCCSLIQGLVDLEAAVCLCLAIKANILGINLNIPIALSLLLNTCGKRVPSGFQCR